MDSGKFVNGIAPPVLIYCSMGIKKPQVFVSLAMFCFESYW